MSHGSKDLKIGVNNNTIFFSKLRRMKFPKDLIK